MSEKIIELLKVAITRRGPLEKITNAMRLVNGAGDGLEGLVLERYNRHFVAQFFDKYWLSRIELLSDFLKDRFGAQYFIVKDRTESLSSVPGRFKTQVLIGDAASDTTVEENGFKFSVDLNDALNSGLFLDMRANRKIVSEISPGKKVLNCFAYTCSFGVYCRGHGAKSVTNVDISKKSLNRGRLNYELNRLIPSESEFIPADAVFYLERAVKKDNRFDLIILDPPSFAQYNNRAFSLKKNMCCLVELALKSLRKGGIIFASTNFSEMTQEHLIKIIVEASKGRAKIKKRLGQDIDFPGSNLTQESYLVGTIAELS